MLNKKAEHKNEKGKPKEHQNKQQPKVEKNAEHKNGKGKSEVEEVKEEPQYTLDEYKKSQGEKKAHHFDTRKPNEGAENKWGNARKLEKVKLDVPEAEGDKVKEVL